MFLRSKKIKGKDYAYLVKSVYKNKRVRQKVVKYLGKIEDPEQDINDSQNRWHQPYPSDGHRHADRCSALSLHERHRDSGRATSRRCQSCCQRPNQSIEAVDPAFVRSPAWRRGDSDWHATQFDCQ